GLSNVASIHLVSNQLSSGGGQVRIKSQCSFQSRVRTLEHWFPAVSILTAVVVTGSQSLPSGRVAGVNTHSTLQHRDGILIRSNIMRNRDAAQIQVVGLLALGPSSRLPRGR